MRPPWPFRLGGGSADGLLRRRGAALQRLLRVGGEPVLVGIVQPARDRVLFAARSATAEAAREGIARMRFATGVDDDLRPFYERFAGDRVIGKAVRSHPELRVRRKPHPWEALVAAITEQLIEFERAVAIQRRLNAVYGYRCPVTRMRDATTAATLAGEAPARLCAFDLAPRRAMALRRCAEGVARGRIDLADHDVRRLLAIRDIGPWTVEMLALHGHGRYDVVAGRRPRVPEDRRAAADRAPEGPRRRCRGARLLRALRRVEGPGRRVPARGRGLGSHSSPEVPGSTPSPGRNSLVSGGRSAGGCVISSLSRIQRS